MTPNATNLLLDPSALNPVASYILVLEDHPLVVQGLLHYLNSVRPDLPARVAASWQAGQHTIHAHGSPALVLADVWLTDGNSLNALRHCQALCPQTPWLAYSGDDDPTLQQQVREAGAQGFVHKQAPIEDFAQALAALLGGMPNKRIGQTLAVTESTVKEHVTSILGRLGVRTRVEAIARLQGRRLAPAPAL